MAKKKKPECEAKTQFCSGQGVRKVTRTRKGDPVFRCCLACRAILGRSGLKLKDAD
jgi:hypothetical protein